jgi:hypothetical protein
MVYVANWGTHRLLIGVPPGTVAKDATAFECDGLEIRTRGNRTIIDLRSELEEPEEFETGDEWMPVLTPIRS